MKFGDYVEIEQKNYGCENEMYIYKVIGCLKSNFYIDIPVEISEEEYIHNKIVGVVSCICCGVEEREVHYYKKSDVKKVC